MAEKITQVIFPNVFESLYHLKYIKEFSDSSILFWLNCFLLQGGVQGCSGVRDHSRTEEEMLHQAKAGS